MAKPQPRRQKCQPKVYTESDFRAALRQTAINMEKHNLQLAIGCFALALYKKLNLNGDQIQEILDLVQRYSFDALCYQDVRQEVKQHTGLDLDVCIDFD